MQKSQRNPSEGLPSPTLPPPPHETQSNQKFNSKNPHKQDTPLADMSAVPSAETTSPSITLGSDWAGHSAHVRQRRVLLERILGIEFLVALRLVRRRRE